MVRNKIPGTLLPLPHRNFNSGKITPEEYSLLSSGIRFLSGNNIPRRLGNFIPENIPTRIFCVKQSYGGRLFPEKIFLRKNFPRAIRSKLPPFDIYNGNFEAKYG